MLCCAVEKDINQPFLQLDCKADSYLLHPLHLLSYKSREKPVELLV